MGGACSTNGERRGVYRVLAGKPEGKRPRRRLEDNINILVGEWTGLIWLRIWTGGGNLYMR
jgi:hypothetical protein